MQWKPRVPRVPDAFELFVAWLCMVSGLPLALGAPAPNSITRFLPGWLIHCWGGLLFIGGLLVVVGIGIRKRRHDNITGLLLGLRIERAGLTPLAAGVAVFGLVIAATGGWRVLLPFTTYLGFSAACLARTVEARDTERGLQNAVRRSKESGQ